MRGQEQARVVQNEEFHPRSWADDAVGVGEERHDAILGRSSGGPQVGRDLGQPGQPHRPSRAALGSRPLEVVHVGPQQKHWQRGHDPNSVGELLAETRVREECHGAMPIAPLAVVADIGQRALDQRRQARGIGVGSDRRVAVHAASLEHQIGQPDDSPATGGRGDLARSRQFRQREPSSDRLQVGEVTQFDPRIFLDQVETGQHGEPRQRRQINRGTGDRDWLSLDPKIVEVERKGNFCAGHVPVEVDDESAAVVDEVQLASEPVCARSSLVAQRRKESGRLRVVRGRNEEVQVQARAQGRAAVQKGRERRPL